MAAKKIEKYLLVGIALFCLLKGYTALLMLLLAVELVFSRVIVRSGNK